MESAKKCVTTYLPNESAPKMDGAQALSLYSTVVVIPKKNKGTATSRKA